MLDSYNLRRSLIINCKNIEFSFKPSTFQQSTDKI